MIHALHWDQLSSIRIPRRCKAKLIPDQLSYWHLPTLGVFMHNAQSFGVRAAASTEEPLSPLQIIYGLQDRIYHSLPGIGTSM